MNRLCRMLPVVLLGLPVSVQADEQVYRNVLPSVVWVNVQLDDYQNSYGTGVVVDTVHRWILTNAHVVRDATQVSVLFPQKSHGRVIAERDFYRTNFDHLAVTGKVIYHDVSNDLAVIEVETLPGSARAVAKATTGATPGQRLHAIGNPGKMEALWVYTTGYVRQTYHKRWRAQTNTGKTVALQAQVVETNVAINPGDSGGPVVNDKGELVAIVSSYDRNSELVSTCIALSEIQKVLTRAKVQPATVVKDVKVNQHATFYTPPLQLPQYLPDVPLMEENDVPKADRNASKK